MANSGRLTRGEVPPDVMEHILRKIAGMRYGQVALVAQDGFLVQVECLEKIRLEEGRMLFEERKLQEGRSQQLARHIRRSFQNLQYGKMILDVRRGEIAQTERVVKQHFTGMDGEGI